MTRLVKKTAHAPQLVEGKLICMCGLSKDQPFCDKSHLKTSKEEDGKLYWYDGDKCEEVETMESDCCGEGECKRECHEDKCCGEGECKGDCDGECGGDCHEDNCCKGGCCGSCDEKKEENEENLKEEE